MDLIKIMNVSDLNAIQTVEDTYNYMKFTNYPKSYLLPYFMCYQSKQIWTLLTGDIDITSVNNEVTRYFERKKILGRKFENMLVFQIPHHGSKKNWDSDSQAFGFSIKHSARVVNYGMMNTYGHPSKDLMKKEENESYWKFFLNNEIFRVFTDFN